MVFIGKYTRIEELIQNKKKIEHRLISNNKSEDPSNKILIIDNIRDLTIFLYLFFLDNKKINREEVGRRKGQFDTEEQQKIKSARKKKQNKKTISRKKKRGYPMLMNF